MNIRDRLIHLAHKVSLNDRQTGRTTLLAKACKDMNGVYICHNFEFAKKVKHDHTGLVTKSMEVNLDGLMGPFIMDHAAVGEMFLKAASSISQKEMKITTLEQENKGLKSLSSQLAERLDVSDKNLQSALTEVKRKRNQIEALQEKLEKIKSFVKKEFDLKDEYDLDDYT